ncbi:hypothetical protein [Curtobacterium flaccumfaciens]|uniref:hypothetical protein n=1 Tax=Curtobacterium flaccumfaciens TaxID=2035 RepID=UPI001ADCE1DE|nr:hypothetical protein [Curtobacterium flaccumfaciens]MBO9051631.1 hypothetical protein [Curtobacterium flaccumfaciens pv. flaccumfaciens]
MHPIAEWDVREWIDLCASCAKSRPGSECTGWKLDVRPDKPIRLGPFVDKSTLIEARIMGHQDYRRSTSGSSAVWTNSPVESGSLALELWDTSATSRLHARYHFDLANYDQAGPVWHLQVGGKGTHDSTVRLDLPRLAVAPIDLCLLIDHILYNYKNKMWTQLLFSAGYIARIRASEEFMLSAWIDQLTRYKTGLSRGRTLVHELDNVNKAGWNPRPSASS